MENYVCRFSSHVKRKGNMSEHCETTQSLRNKLSEFRELPVSDDESWVPLCQIDDSDENDEVRMVVIFGTNKTLGYLKMSDTFHCDATYRHILCNLKFNHILRNIIKRKHCFMILLILDLYNNISNTN